MKRFVLTAMVLLFLCPFAYSAPLTNVIARMLIDEDSGTCTQGSENASDTCSEEDGYSALLATNAKLTQFTAQDTYSSYGLRVHMRSGSGTSVMVCRIGTSSDLSSYMASATLSTSVTTPAGEDVIGAWDSSVSITTSTTYYIGCLEISGAVELNRDSAGGCANMNERYASDSGSPWDLDQTSDYDYNWGMIECAP